MLEAYSVNADVTANSAVPFNSVSLVKGKTALLSPANGSGRGLLCLSALGYGWRHGTAARRTVPPGKNRKGDAAGGERNQHTDDSRQDGMPQVGFL